VDEARVGELVGSGHRRGDRTDDQRRRRICLVPSRAVVAQRVRRDDPAAPAGTLAWSWATTGPNDICGLAVSFDDKLGLRHFIGGAEPNAGVSCTP